MRKFLSLAQAQHFLSCYGDINNRFRRQCHLLKAKHYRLLSDRTLDEKVQVTCAKKIWERLHYLNRSKEVKFTVPSCVIP